MHYNATLLRNVHISNVIIIIIIINNRRDQRRRKRQALNMLGWSIIWFFQQRFQRWSWAVKLFSLPRCGDATSPTFQYFPFRKFQAIKLFSIKQATPYVADMSTFHQLYLGPTGHKSVGTHDLQRTANNKGPSEREMPGERVSGIKIVPVFTVQTRCGSQIQRPKNLQFCFCPQVEPRNDKGRVSGEPPEGDEEPNGSGVGDRRAGASLGGRVDLGFWERQAPRHRALKASTLHMVASNKVEPKPLNLVSPAHMDDISFFPAHFSDLMR